VRVFELICVIGTSIMLEVSRKSTCSFPGSEGSLCDSCDPLLIAHPEKLRERTSRRPPPPDVWKLLVNDM